MGRESQQGGERQKDRVHLLLTVRKANLSLLEYRAREDGESGHRQSSQAMGALRRPLISWRRHGGRRPRAWDTLKGSAARPCPHGQSPICQFQDCSFPNRQSE